MHPPWPTLILLLCMLWVCIPLLHCSASQCLEEDLSIGDGNDTLVSTNNQFELGFFTPDGDANESRYLGIWYNRPNPRIVVWVANREAPLPGANGTLIVRNGNAAVLDENNKTYWSTDPSRPPVQSPRGRLITSVGSHLQSAINFSYNRSTNFSNQSTPSTRLCLEDSGNLILYDRRDGRDDQNSWQSFDHPTDTFLPGMSSDGSFKLVSWEAPGNPAEGTFALELQPKLLQLAVLKSGSKYWENGDTPFDAAPQAALDLLLGNGTQNGRLVINSAGQVQFWIRERGSWSLSWVQPEDRCSCYKSCGVFGSCNSNNAGLCKCLPGFEPRALDNWNSGDFSGGCSPKTESCQRNSSDDIFLRLPMMKVGTSNNKSSSEDQDCKTSCREDCDCVAYSCGRDDCPANGSSPGNCMTWTNTYLTNLQEDYSQGFTIFIRTTQPDFALTSRDCRPCGTYVIPYPLSTGPKCGDPSYSHFHCNMSSGQVGFSTSQGTFKVASVTPDAKKFSIQVRNANGCDIGRMESAILSPNNSLPFKVTNCSAFTDNFLVGHEQTFVEVEMEWNPPLEPACRVASDCVDWPHTTCKPAGGGQMRCICQSKFRWDGSALKCTRVRFPIKAVAASIAAAAAAVALLCGAFFIYRSHKRSISNRKGSDEDGEYDTEGIDVPFFSWGSILAATDNFADANKLGTGGFGPVYKGVLSDGKEVAVKRLSSVSAQGDEEFRTEVVLIAKLQHRNLVRLLGYCLKANEKILLYEYLPNGSLDSCLFDEACSIFLDWEKRFDIVFGIARGLLYLHQDSRLRIIHRDLKPSNILLDEELKPKISDFGIARIVGGKETEASTNKVVGTYGYMSPEYAYEGLFSVKSDVFSFGVVILEIVCGRRNSKTFQIQHGLSLLAHAWELWNEGRGLELIDQNLKGKFNTTEVLKCIHVGLLCVQEDPSDRPIMSNVFLMLSSESASLPPPKQPAFSVRRSSLPSDTSASSSSALCSSSSGVMTASTQGR